MGHAAGQVADGLELLRLPELRLQPFALGEIARDAVDARGRAGALDQPEADLHLGLVAFRPADLEHRRRRGLVALQRGHHIDHARLFPWGHHILEPERGKLGTRAAGQPFTHLVDRGERPVQTQREHHVVGVLEQLAVRLLGFPPLEHLRVQLDVGRGQLLGTFLHAALERVQRTLQAVLGVAFRLAEGADQDAHRREETRTQTVHRHRLGRPEQRHHVVHR